MLRIGIFAFAVIAFVAITQAYGSAKCELVPAATLPITMNRLRPTISAKINGRDAQFILDSGAFYSVMSPAAAVEYDLKLSAAPFGLQVTGIGGSSAVRLATVKEFSVAGSSLKNIDFLVGGSDTSNAGLLGQNFLEKFDVEYDFANGVVRLFHTDNCEKEFLAYWVKPGGAYSAMHIDKILPLNPFTVGIAYINGKQIKVAFDTGAYTSLLSTSAAARAGVKPDSPGVVDAGYTGGVGKGSVKTFVAPFDSFKIGDDEEIKHTELRIADVELKSADMLLGADFFISHRIFVANKEHRLYLTYNGGPVFNLSKRAVAETAAEAPDSNGAAAQPETAGGAPPEQAAKPADAADIARHGSALAARREFVPALAELTKAININPDEPEYYFERANAYWSNGQADLAFEDFNHVISLKRDFLPAYIPRAELQFAKKDMAAGFADLYTVDQLAAKPADLRFMLAELYQRLDHFQAAIAQYTLWMQYHADDSRMASALQGRCLCSALQNQDLPTGLNDCNTALRRADKKNANYPHLWTDRGLVRLRLGDDDRALADFNDALKALPKEARALYGRSVVEARKSKKAESDADLAAAEKLAPKIAERFQRYGIVP